MVLIVLSAAAGAVVRVRCPRCGHVQARGRIGAGALYRCRECRHAFTMAAGVYEASPPGSRDRETRRRR